VDATARMFELALGQILWAKRSIFMALLVAGPVVLALVSRVTFSSGAAIRINGARLDGGTMFGFAIWTLYLRFIVPAVGVFYGTSLIADEVDEKTITYLFTRPIRRAAIVLGKYLAYLVHVTAIVLPSVAILFVLMVPFTGMAGIYTALVTDLGVIALGIAAYGALFLLAGVVLKRSLVAGLVFAFGWEQIALVMPGYLRHFTIAYYLQALSPQATPVEDTFGVLQVLSNQFPSPAASVLSLAVITLAALLLAMRVVERREYVLEH
jgi:ABC-type transport system involved in multi-copper enzyme maturation permease subunit